MFYPGMQQPLLHMLHAQHRYYTSELGNTHKQLGKQYKKLASIELDLIQRNEKKLTRQQKKSLQWSRCHAKAAVKSLESQQTWLHDYIRQCNDLIASCEGSVLSSPVTPWSAFPSQDLLSTMSGLTTPTAWTAAPPTPFQPQYWDLSMLRERREPSPFAPSWSADSGFEEANTSAVQHAQGFIHPIPSSSARSGAAPTAALAPSSQETSGSEKDDLPEIMGPSSPAQSGASPTSPHKRRYSENAIQLIESRLSAPKQPHHQRGNSASATPVPHRNLSVHTAIASP